MERPFGLPQKGSSQARVLRDDLPQIREQSVCGQLQTSTRVCDR
jgi:hypothetical protein